MSCLCGDICCNSCGPAQGNWKCPICGEWASECCEHIGEDGNILPEFQAEAEEKARQEAEAYSELAAQLEDEERLAEEYWRSQGR